MIKPWLLNEKWISDSKKYTLYFYYAISLVPHLPLYKWCNNAIALQESNTLPCWAKKNSNGNLIFFPVC